MKKLLLLLFLITANVNVFAQPANAVREVIDGKEYYIHKVEKGETIYGIAKTYKSTQEAILAANPGSEKGIAPGQKLKIPVKAGSSTANDEKEKQYQDAIAQGDKALKSKEYDKAITFYNQALKLKPSDNTAEEKIKAAKELQAVAKAGKSDNVEVAEYTVAKGETVYGIAKKFNTTQEKLIELNPEIKTGVAVGQKIKVPKNQSVKSVDKQMVITNEIIEPVAKGDIVLVEHVVQKNETLFSLSQKYKTSQDSIKLFNNGLPEGIKRGQSLVIPVEKSYAVAQGFRWYPDLRSIDEHHELVANAVRKDVYEVGLFLPFYLDKNQATLENRSPQSNAELFEPTRQSLDFYHGVLLAVDSLKTFGLSVNLHVYDTYRDSARLMKLIAEPEFTKFDLIIGPTDMIEPVARAARDNKIPLICPFGYTNKILFDNQFVAKAVTSTGVMIDVTSEFIVKNYSKENIVLIDGKGKKDEAAVKSYKKQLNDNLAKAGIKDTVKYVRCDSYSSKLWVEKLSKDKINVLVVPSNDYSFVSSFFNNLTGTSLKYNYKDYRFVLFGTDEWLKYDEIEPYAKVKFSLHVPSPVYVSFTDSLTTVPFIKSFRSKFKTDPDKYAMMGFDIAYFFLGGYHSEGKDFYSNLENYDVEGVNTRFRFRRINENSGYLNTNVYILKYENYELVKQ